MKYIRIQRRKKKRKKDYLIENLFEEVIEEISKYPQNILIEFMKIFPCEDASFTFPIGPIKVDNKIVIVKGRSVGCHYYSVLSKRYKLFDMQYVSCSSIKDFWDRWNRFKKLKVFL